MNTANLRELIRTAIDDVNDAEGRVGRGVMSASRGMHRVEQVETRLMRALMRALLSNEFGAKHGVVEDFESFMVQSDLCMISIMEHA